MLDMDEELKRIIEASLMQGRAPARPDEGMDLAAIRAAGQGMTRSGGEDLPRGTKVNFAEPELEVSAPPTRKVITPRAPEEKVVQVPGTPAEPDDMELAYARQQDRMGRSNEAFERGSRQLVAGLTRTPVQDTFKQPVDAVTQLYAQRKQRDATHAQNEQGRLGAARLNYDQSEAQRKAAEERAAREAGLKTDAEKEAWRRQHEGEVLSETKRHNLGTEANGRISALKPSGLAGGPIERDEDGNLVPKTVRDALRVDALKPRPGWEKIDSTAGTFRDADQAKQFDTAAAAFGALQNHRAHAAEALKRLRAAKSPQEADTALAEVNQQMANIASKLRVAEGLNSSDASNHAVDTMLSLTNGSIANLRNFANEGRLDAILDSSINSAKTNLDTLAGSANLRRSKSGKPAAARPTATGPDGQKIEWDGSAWVPVK